LIIHTFTLFVYPLDLVRLTSYSIQAVASFCSFYFDGVASLYGPSLGRKVWSISYFLSGCLSAYPSGISISIYILETVVHFCAFILSILSVYFSSSKIQYYAPPREYTDDLLSYITFSYSTPLIKLSMEKGSLEFEDVPNLSDGNTCNIVWEQLRKNLIRSKLNLFWSLFWLVFPDWLEHGAFQLAASSALFIAPICLRRILAYVSQSGDHGNDQGGGDGSEESSSFFGISFSVEAAVILLVIGPLFAAIANGQNYLRGR